MLASHRVKAILNNPAQASRNSGKPVVGYFCAYTPVEVIHAAGAVPYRLRGDYRNSPSRVDAYLETNVCPFIRSCFDMALGGRYDFLDGLVVPHTCDMIEKIGEIWSMSMKPRFYFFLNVPHISHPGSWTFFGQEIRSLSTALRSLTGMEPSLERLHHSIELYRRNRSLLCEIGLARKERPPRITGAEMTELVLADLSVPVEEANDLLAQFLQGLPGRQSRQTSASRPRLLVYGCEIDDPTVMRLIEESGGDVVADDLCIGTRFYWEQVPETPDDMAALSRYYVDRIHCPRTYREAGSQERFGYLRDIVRTLGVDAAVLYMLSYCDSHEFDVPDVRDFLQGLGVPVLQLDDDYSAGNSARLSTRIQAFLEMVNVPGSAA